jgi:XTP/dITP diphosphohydrolase
MTGKEILVGTQNLDKLREISEILCSVAIKAVSLAQFPSLPEVEETGSSYEENAILKATAFSQATGLPCISDDTGLEVAFLGGRPGVHSARWAGVQGTDRYAANNRKLLEELQGVPMEKRTAKFVCVIVLVANGQVCLQCRGECLGRIALSLRGSAGFGYDPLFEVPAYQKTFAELGNDIKNKISHRARAVAKFAEEFAYISNKI